ncbi:hypothetical protein Acsp05_57650 [Actinokineospora sp. NBRC 105648]|nr:hypothetical protein Acsp05_57650 [Actinokineospora sp. NBRC 105648]
MGLGRGLLLVAAGGGLAVVADRAGHPGQGRAQAVGVALDADEQREARAGERDQARGDLAGVHAQPRGDLVHRCPAHFGDHTEQAGINRIRHARGRYPVAPVSAPEAGR